MAKERTIPVSTIAEYGEKAVTFQLPESALVLVLVENSWNHYTYRNWSRHDLSDCIVEPLRLPRKRVSLKPRLWQLRVRPDALNCFGHPFHDAGKVVASFSSERLYGLAVGTKVLFQHEGEWFVGLVNDYPKWREEKKATTKAVKKAAYKQRRRNERPSRYDMLMGEDII
jgi:hypothetical protein